MIAANAKAGKTKRSSPAPKVQSPMAARTAHRDAPAASRTAQRQQNLGNAAVARAATAPQQATLASQKNAPPRVLGNGAIARAAQPPTTPRSNAAPADKTKTALVAKPAAPLDAKRTAPLGDKQTTSLAASDTSAAPALAPTNAAQTAGAPQPQLASAAVPSAIAVPVQESGPGAGPVTAAKDDRLQKVTAEVRHAGHAQKQHDSAESKAEESRQAVGVSAEQAAGEGKSQKVADMSSKKRGPFDRETFKAKLRAKILALQADDAKAIKDGDKAEGINAAVRGEVQSGKEAAGGPITQSAQQAPPAGNPKAGGELPKTHAGDRPQVDASGAVPPAVPDDKVSMAAPSRSLDEQMAAAKVNPEQLRKSNEPAFLAAADAKTNAQAQADAVPAQARAREQQALTQAQGAAVAVTHTGLDGMHGVRSGLLGVTRDQQVAGKGKLKEAKSRITARLNAIYDRTQKGVDERLKRLDADVAKAFDDGASSAKTDFYLFLAAELLQYFVGGGWLVDAFTDGNDYQAIFDRGRRRYLADLDRVIDDVATLVEVGLNEVVDLIANGKREIDEVLLNLPADEKEVAKDVAAGVRDKFADLETSVENKQQELIDSLAQKYVTAVKDVDSVICSLRDPVGAVIAAAKETLGGVIETILKMRDLLMGVLAKAGEAIDLILADPIGFLGHLVAGVKQGVMNFVDNIGIYLQKGLLDWLFGALAGAGIQMPEKFDMSGLLHIVLQVLGLTYANIRKRAVGILGEKMVATLETASEIFMTLITKGAAGLWEYIKEQASTLLETLKDGIKTFVIENVVKAGVKWLIGLLNPASAFVKACLAIYDVIMFVIDKGQQILAFVNAVLDSILSIAKGVITPAAKAVEAALARAVPVAIGFLASLAGLGDLSKDIKAVIDKIQAPINKIIDWVIQKAVQLVKAIGKMFGFGKDQKKDEQNSPQGVKGVALEMLRGRISGDHSPTEIQTVLGTILHELKPQGLQRLYLDEPDANGKRSIMAEASPLDELAQFVVGDRIVTLAAIVNINDETDLETHLAGEFAYESITGKKGDVSDARKLDQIRVQKKAPQPSSGYQFKPTPGSGTIKILAWNTTQSESGSNVSHAERQFVHWLTSRPEIMRRLTQITIELTHSPCGSGIHFESCTIDLVRLGKTLKDQNGTFSGVIRFLRPWTNEKNATTDVGIKYLNLANWTVTDLSMADPSSCLIHPRK